MELLITQVMSKEDLEKLIYIFNKKTRVSNDQKDSSNLEQSEAPIL